MGALRLGNRFIAHAARQFESTIYGLEYKYKNSLSVSCLCKATRPINVHNYKPDSGRRVCLRKFVFGFDRAVTFVHLRAANKSAICDSMFCHVTDMCM